MKRASPPDRSPAAVPGFFSFFVFRFDGRPEFSLATGALQTRVDGVT
jgi:hypothetical protein